MPPVTGKEQFLAYGDEAAFTSWKWAGGVFAGGPSDGFTRRAHRWTGGRGITVPGRNQLGGAVSLDVTADTVPMMQYAIPNGSGVLSELKVAGHTGHRSWVHGGCYVSRLAWSLRDGECLKTVLNWMSLPPYDGTAAPAEEPTPGDEMTFEDWAGTLTVAGSAALEVVDASGVAQNFVRYWGSIKSRSAGSLRNVDGMLYGSQECTATVTALVPPSLTLLADDPDTPASLTLTCTNTLSDVAVKTITLTVPNLVWSAPPAEAFQTSRGEPVRWTTAMAQSTFAPMTLSII